MEIIRTYSSSPQGYTRKGEVNAADIGKVNRRSWVAMELHKMGATIATDNYGQTVITTDASSLTTTCVDLADLPDVALRLLNPATHAQAIEECEVHTRLASHKRTYTKEPRKHQGSNLADLLERNGARPVTLW